MTRAADGSVLWTCAVKRDVHRYYMNGEKIAELLAPPKPRAAGKKALLGVLDFIDAFGPGDSPYSELPSEMFAQGTAAEIPTFYRYMISIKGDRARNRIKVFAEGSPRYIYFSSPEQYDYVYGFIVPRCKNAKIK